MAGWYNKVSDNLSNIIDCIEYFEAELEDAKKECEPLKIIPTLSKDSYIWVKKD